MDARNQNKHPKRDFDLLKNKAKRFAKHLASEGPQYKAFWPHSRAEIRVFQVDLQGLVVQVSRQVKIPRVLDTKGFHQKKG